MPNGKLIKTNPNKKDTDSDGLTDGEEMGWIYTENANKLVNAYKIIGINRKMKVKFCLLYSNPIKKDTDGDYVNDAKDPYPWHGYCGGKHPERTNVHSCNLNSSGYYGGNDIAI